MSEFLRNGFYKVLVPGRRDGNTGIFGVEMVVKHKTVLLVIDWDSNQEGERVEPSRVVAIPVEALSPLTGEEWDAEFQLHGFLDVDAGTLEVVDHPIPGHPHLSPQ